MGATISTFSVGIFQWLPKTNGKGCRKSAVKVRIRGSVKDFGAVYTKAAEIVAALDAGTYTGKRNVNV
jgi:hypothetical protein